MRLDARYQVLRRLGRGGAGEVFLVRDSLLDKELALKLLGRSFAERGGLDELEREFHLLARIEHPGIARAYDFGHIRGRPYFTRDCVAGSVLSEEVPIRDPERLLAVALGLAAALAYLHRGGILHLDVKPANVVLTDPDAGGRPVLIDFGLFRRRVDDPPAEAIRGSLPYMAPECFSGGAMGPWTDVYAFGATLYQVGTGSLPRAPRRPGSSAREKRLPSPTALRRPSALSGGLPSGLDAVILKCLALDPSARYPSAEELLDALRVLAPSDGRELRAPLPAPRTAGREVELARIDALLSDLHTGGGAASPESAARCLLVTGAPGMGQTHLLSELKVRGQTQGLRVHVETGYPGRAGTAALLFRFLAENLEQRARRRWQRFLVRLRRPRSAALFDTSDAERRLRWSGEVSLAAAALRRPVVLAVDGLEHFDEVAIALVTELTLAVTSRGGTRPPVGLVLGYREEGPFQASLRELSEIVLAGGRAAVLALRALDPIETLQLHREATDAGAPVRSDLSLWQETRGCPARILALAARGASPAQPLAPAPQSVESSRDLDELDRIDREILGAFALLGRPASSYEVARALRLRRRDVEARLERYRRLGLAEPIPESDGRGAWIVSRFARAGIDSLVTNTPRLHRLLHRRLAESLAADAAGDDDPRFLESVSHWVAAGARRQVARYGLRAARYLKATFQHRAARDILVAVASTLPPRAVRARIEVALELAEVHTRLGDYDDGLRRLRVLLPRVRRLPGPWLRRVLGRLASLHSRSGDFRRADALFREALLPEGAGRSQLPLDERIEFLNEHAAMKVFSAQYEEASALCDQGLERVERSRRLRLRELALNLFATRANVALRTLRFADAVRDLERSLELAAAVGSLANQAVILNNLGVAYAETDRIADAVRTFHEAERACLELDEGPSLTFVYGNLAVLHAKLGDFRAVERAIAEGERWLAPLPSESVDRPQHASRRRQALFFAHHAGLAWLYRGRFARSRTRLEAAIALADGIGDVLVARVDEVYRAECLLFEGRYAPSLEALERLAAPGLPALVRRLATPRLALLRALLGQTRELEVTLAEEAKLGTIAAAPFVGASADLFAGWALSLAGQTDAARQRLERAAEYFHARKLQPPLSVLRCVSAEAWILTGDPTRALAELDRAPAPAGDLAAALHPILTARALLAAGGSGNERDRAADAAASGLGAMVGNSLLEWEMRLEAVRASLFAGQGQGAEEALERVRDIARVLGHGLAAEVRRGIGDRGHWKRWNLGLAGGETAGKVKRKPATSTSRRGRGSSATPNAKTHPSTATVSLPESSSPPHDAIVARSSAMRELTATLVRLRATELPVVITGETGTGKELVARVIHAESRRRAGPFVVVDAASIPGPLFEAELFGACSGAFTGIQEDRAGLLAQADGGTALVDHVTALPLDAQAKLLRALAGGKLRPVGGLDERRVDVRFLLTSDKDLEEEVRQGRMRPDLYYRVRVLAVHVPPLRERGADLAELVEAFLAESGARAPRMTPEAIAALRRLPFPGNVRQLRNLVARLRLENPVVVDRDAVLALAGQVETAPALPRELLDVPRLEAVQDRVEREYILYHLERLEGDTRKLAALLGVGRKQLYRRSRQLGIRLRDERQRLRKQ